MSEISIGMTASEGVVLTVLADLKNGKIDDAIACFGERSFADRVPNGSSQCLIEGESS